MKLSILFVVVVGAVLVWWLRSVKPKRRICSRPCRELILCSSEAQPFGAAKQYGRREPQG